MTMGAYDGSRVSEPVGTFSLDKINEKYPKVASVYNVTMGCQYLKTALKLERIKRAYKKHSRTLV